MGYVVIAGIFVALIGSLCTAGGYISQRLGHLRKAENPDDKIKPIGFLALGILLLTLGNVSSLVNYGLLGELGQAPSAALTLLYNALLARFVLKEEYHRYDFVSSFLIILGVGVALGALTSYNGDASKNHLKDIEQLFFYTNPGPIIYTTCVVILMVVLNIFIYRKGDKTLTVKLLSYSFTAGFLGGFTGMLVTAAFQIWGNVATDPADHDYLKEGTYIITVLVAPVLILQLYFMNQGLKYFGALMFVPPYQSFIIFSNILCGIIYFGDLHHFSNSMIAIFFVGSAITLSGVLVLLAKVREFYLAEQNGPNVAEKTLVDAPALHEKLLVVGTTTEQPVDAV